MLPVGAHLLLSDGAEVFRATSSPRFRGNPPRQGHHGRSTASGRAVRGPEAAEHATITEIDGAVEFAGFVKGMRKIVIRADDGETKEY